VLLLFLGLTVVHPPRGRRGSHVGRLLEGVVAATMVPQKGPAGKLCPARLRQPWWRRRRPRAVVMVQLALVVLWQPLTRCASWKGRPVMRCITGRPCRLLPAASPCGGRMRLINSSGVAPFRLPVRPTRVLHPPMTSGDLIAPFKPSGHRSPRRRSVRRDSPQPLQYLTEALAGATIALVLVPEAVSWALIASLPASNARMASSKG
jgi:hypothetical protein